MRKLFWLLWIPMVSLAKIPENLDTKTPPKRIIRTCCSFGVDVKVAMLPFVKVTDITALPQLGAHKFLGDKQENNGIIYTHKGGFIDMGHLRDIADYTAYLYALIKENRDSEVIDFKLGKEAGVKRVSFQIPSYFTDEDMAKLAGKIAYDLSVWHEISTWYGSSYIPFVPERYSSFSMEDAYSNLMGVHLSIQALLSDQPYEEAMTQLISDTLNHLEAVETLEDTREAMNQVKDIWWSGSARFPSRKVLIKRQYDILGKVSPWVLEKDYIEGYPYGLDVPSFTSKGQDFNEIYTLQIKVNSKIPVKKIFGEVNKERNITQNDFQKLIEYAQGAEAVNQLAELR